MVYESPCSTSVLRYPCLVRLSPLACGSARAGAAVAAVIVLAVVIVIHDVKIFPQCSTRFF